MYTVVSHLNRHCAFRRQATKSVANCRSSVQRFFSKGQRRKNFREEQYFRKSTQFSLDEHKVPANPGHSDDVEGRSTLSSAKASSVINNSALDHSMSTKDTCEVTDQTSVTRTNKKECTAVIHQGLTEHEIYNIHMQKYLEDTMEEYLGDLLNCQDVEFLLNYPDEADVDKRHQEELVPTFEFAVPLFIEESALECDECSVITLTFK